MSALVGKWSLESSENFEEFMKALGVGFAMRKMASSLKPILHVTQEGKNWNIKTESTFKTVELAFQDGVEFAEETLDGRKSKTTITYHDNGQLVQEQRNPETGAVVAKITRQVDANDKMHVNYVTGETQANRIFKRV